MTENKQPSPNEPIDDQYVLDKYNSKIGYYWGASRSNKNSYKRYRAWTVILGALVTLVSSISAAEFVQKPEWLNRFCSGNSCHCCYTDGHQRIRAKLPLGCHMARYGH